MCAAFSMNSRSCGRCPLGFRADRRVHQRAAALAAEATHAAVPFIAGFQLTPARGADLELLVVEIAAFLARGRQRREPTGRAVLFAEDAREEFSAIGMAN